MARRSERLGTRAGTVEVEITGAGPDLLILHGSGGGFDQGTWIAHALGLRGYRVIAISRPAYLGTPDCETIGEAAELCVATLDALEVEHAAVIGASGGGLCAAALAIGHPERVGALVMLSAVSGPVMEGGRPLLGHALRASRDVNGAILNALRTRRGRVLVTELAATLAAPERRLPGVSRDLAVARSFARPITSPRRPWSSMGPRTEPCQSRTRSGPWPSARAVNSWWSAGGGHLCCMTHPEVGERTRVFLKAHVA